MFLHEQNVDLRIRASVWLVVIFSKFEGTLVLRNCLSVCLKKTLEVNKKIFSDLKQPHLRGDFELCLRR